MIIIYRTFLEQYTFLGNTAWQWAIAGVIFISLLLILKVFQLFLLARLKKLAKKTKGDIDDVLVDIAAGIRSIFYIMVSVFVASQYLVLHPLLQKAIDLFFYVVLIAEAIRIIESISTYGMKAYLRRREQGAAEQKAMVNMALIFIRIALWSLGILFILSNLGVNVTSLIASLGIGGVAVAFALQNLLSDVFSSFSILFDKPFSIGDFIVVGQDSGVVQKIGLKTTRIKTLRGEEMVIPNRDLTTARVQNLKTLERRRETLNFGIVYQTDAKTLASIPSIVQGIVEKQEDVTFDRCHFVSYGESALLFETVYHVESPEYPVYMNAKQAVNLALFKQFEQKGISFAYPTQTLFVKK